MFVVFLFLIFLGFINLCVLDYVLWWSVFVVCTFVFVFFIKGCVYYGSLVNYYVVQEICGYYFLVFSNWKIQFLILILKSGCAPFHFWLFSVVGGLNKWFLMWFLVLQKLPYLFVLVNFSGEFFFFLLFLGVVVCYFQFFLLRDFLSMLVLSSTESFSWLLFLSMFSFNEVFFFVFFYYFVMFVIVFYVVGDSGFSFFSLECLMVFFNVPLSVTFLLKVLLLVIGGSYVGLYYFFVLLILSLMSLGLGFWFFFLSMFEGFGIKYYDCYFFFLLIFMFLSYL